MGMSFTDLDNFYKAITGSTKLQKPKFMQPTYFLPRPLCEISRHIKHPLLRDQVSQEEEVSPSKGRNRPSGAREATEHLTLSMAAFAATFSGAILTESYIHANNALHKTAMGVKWASQCQTHWWEITKLTSVSVTTIFYKQITFTGFLPSVS